MFKTFIAFKHIDKFLKFIIKIKSSYFIKEQLT